MENTVKEARTLGYRGWRMLRKHGEEALRAGIVAVKKRRAGETLNAEDKEALQKMIDTDCEHRRAHKQQARYNDHMHTLYLICKLIVKVLLVVLGVVAVIIGTLLRYKMK